MSPPSSPVHDLEAPNRRIVSRSLQQKRLLRLPARSRRRRLRRHVPDFEVLLDVHRLLPSLDGRVEDVDRRGIRGSHESARQVSMDLRILLQSSVDNPAKKLTTVQHHNPGSMQNIRPLRLLDRMLLKWQSSEHPLFCDAQARDAKSSAPRTIDDSALNMLKLTSRNFRISPSGLRVLSPHVHLHELAVDVAAFDPVAVDGCTEDLLPENVLASDAPGGRAQHVPDPLILLPRDEMPLALLIRGFVERSSLGPNADCAAPPSVRMLNWFTTVTPCSCRFSVTRWTKYCRLCRRPNTLLAYMLHVAELRS
jgi:hypothetical protein